MTKFIPIAVLAATLLAGTPLVAHADDSDYQAFGATPGLTRIVDDFVATVLPIRASRISSPRPIFRI